MSYSLTIRATRGELTVEHSGDVPDGTYSVNGHDDPGYEQLSAGSNAADGRPLLFASVTRYKEH